MTVIHFSNKAKINGTNQSLSKKQMQYDIGYPAIKGNSEQQARAEQLINDLKYRLGEDFNKNSDVYTKLAIILSKDKNATVEDVLNTYSLLASPNNNSLLGPQGINQILDDFIRNIGENKIRAEDYFNSEKITVSVIQEMLRKVQHGEDFDFPRGSATEKPNVNDNPNVTQMETGLVQFNNIIYSPKGLIKITKK